tara:strand:- start:137 stop:364 length:228 start_codon:yes stop_codon:yes gene_type:complete
MRKEIETLIDKHDESCEKRGIDPKTGEPKPAPRGWAYAETSVEDNPAPRGWAYAETSVEDNPVLPANFPTPHTDE